VPPAISPFLRCGPILGAPFVDAAGLIAAVRSIEDEADPIRLMRLTVPN
jgi:hypothetical protein